MIIAIYSKCVGGWLWDVVANLDGQLPLPIGRRSTPLRPPVSSVLSLTPSTTSSSGHRLDASSQPESELELERTPVVLVSNQPKPLAPVATQNLGACPGRAGSGIEHRWDLTGSNGNSRKYSCRECRIRVDERKKDGRWVSFRVTKCN